MSDSSREGDAVDRLTEIAFRNEADSGNVPYPSWQDVKWLITEVERLQAEVATLRGQNQALTEQLHETQNRLEHSLSAGIRAEQERDRIRAVVEAARVVDGDWDDQPMYEHAGYSGCLWELRQALAALDAATASPDLQAALEDAHHRRTTGEGEWTTPEELEAKYPSQPHAGG